ncbi:protein charlatan [Anopheles cruzii]|uniref:protein charlatan n=1 Tax=Anopheles cruzii TaxID=68878 RepID=UPI0022EC2F32|nr:protein charlatan [Anopheles cruzii]
MTTLLPTSQSTGVEAYEDMFKEITRKLYGEESAHGLYPHNTQVAQLAQLAPGGPIAPPEGGERSFTTLTQIGYGTTTNVGGHQHTAGGSSQHQHHQHHHHHAATGAGFKSEEHISNAFGLAALMQGGFPPPGTILNPVHFPGASKTPSNISTPSGEDRWNAQHVATGGQHTVTDDAWNGAKPSAPSGAQYRKSHKKAKSDRSGADGAANGAVSGLNIPSTADRGKGSAAAAPSYGSASGTAPAAAAAAAAAAVAAAGGGAVITKRYGCATCPYTTDRRDLFTRHENIHKEDKPFQCYACLKPFNRADHVKKHFLRMHRELEYDIAKTRRYPPSSSSSSSGAGTGGGLGGSSGSKGGYYATTSTSASQASGGTGVPASSSAASLAQMSLNIPSGSFSAGGQMLAIPAHSLDHHHQHSALALNGGHSSQLLHLQQQHHNVQTSHPSSSSSSISIKQEKGGGCPPVNMSTGAGGGGSTGGALPDDKSFVKKVKGEKKFTCAFCPWAGADNWGLKRHLNTHTKPYVCLLCDYKAARSERLATHVFKVHNKKACAKCNFFAEDQLGLEAHLQEAHPHDPTKASGSKGPGSGSSSSGGSGSIGGHSAPSSAHHHHPPSANGNAVLRNLGNAFTSNNLPTNIPSTGNGFGNGTPNGHYHATNVHHAATGNVLTNSNAANLIDTINQHLAATGQQQHPSWLAKQAHRKRGPDLLYSYLEADGSDSGDYARLLHMQAVGRNKASVTQDFHNAGGGDNNGRKSAAPAANPLAFAGGDATSDGVKATDQDSGPASLSLASLLGGDQLSFLQLLATAAVAQQRLQLQSDQQQQQVANQKKQHHHHQSQPKPSTTNAEPIGSSGVPNGVRPYATMVSSPPATSTQHSTTTTTIPNISADSTNGTNNQPLSFVSNGHAIDASTPSVKRRRTNNVSSNDKENLMYRKNVTAPPGAVGVIVSQTAQTPNGTTIVALPASNGLVRNSAKIGHQNHHHHHHHHNHHHHNNNNSSTNNKNINDIFDKVYKKPQGAFAKPTPAAAHSLPTILRTAPPSAVEEDGRAPARSASYEGNAPQCSPSEGEQFSLAEFLKNHTEVSISTVGGNTTGEKAAIAAVPIAEACKPRSPAAHVDQYDSSSSCGSGTSGVSQKRKSESERNPRKQQQPRRIEEPETKLARPLLKVLSPMELDSKLDDEKLQLHEMMEQQQVVCEERGASESPNKLADIRDKHLIQLVTRRRCCRICQRRGQLEHLDNGHYHSKISLLLHTRWRHQGNCEGARRGSQCHQCGAQFSKRYKLILHQKLTGHKGGGWRKGQTKISRIQKADGSTRKLPKKQRKRKPRSRCFTRRRK